MTGHTNRDMKQFKFMVVYLCLCFVIWSVQAHAEIGDVTSPGNTIIGIPDNSNWPANESPPNAIDNNINTKYLHFDGDTQSSGFCVTASITNVPVIGLTLTTANDAPDRDPVAYELYGSNNGINGSYTLIASGTIVDFSQSTSWPRYTKNSTPIIFSNSTPYAFYKLLFPAIRNSSAGCMQIAEVELIGAEGGVWPPVVDAGTSNVLIRPHLNLLLNGTVQTFGTADDLQIVWDLESAPEDIEMQNLVFEPNQYVVNPEVVFPDVPGIYRLSLTATTGDYSVSDEVIVFVSESLCPGADLNADCIVDTLDLIQIAEFWLNSPAYAADLPDLNGQADGIDLADFAVLAEDWTKHGPSAVISEFMAINSAKYPPQENEILDEDNDSSDWIELCNPTDEAINLEGWYLTTDPSDLTEWRIPELTLEPEGFGIIFASGKNRRTPGEPLHTSFNLSGDGGFLALVEPDGRTIAHQYDYRSQFGLLSYGLASPYVQPAESVVLVSPQAPAYAFIPGDDSLGLTWTTPEFEPANWLTGITGVGYEKNSGGTYNYKDLIGLNVASMYGSRTSVYVRIPFFVADLSGLRDLVLSVMYDDGFVAYLNGVQVASANAPTLLTWNATGTAHDDSLAVQYESFTLPNSAVELLRNGVNVLAIYGFNESKNSSDLLFLPRLTVQRDHDMMTTSLVEAYFPMPTPAKRNGTGQMNLGPLVRDVAHTPQSPLETEDLIITAGITQTMQPVGQVEMTYRIGFANEVSLTMLDDGQNADAVAHDNIFTAVIPASAFTAGDMIRWFIQAQDTQGISMREPLFLLEENSPRYFGTVAQNPSIQTNLPVFHYFVQNTAAADTDTGTRGSVAYLNEFYDNVLIHHRGGNTTRGRKIHFNDGYLFRFDPQYERVDEIKLNEEGADTTCIRPILAFPTYENAGVPCSIVFPLHVMQNKSFHGVRIFIEQPDRHFLRRLGLDDNGSFYKVYSDLSSEIPDTKPDEQPERKITRLDEDNSDLLALRAGINPNSSNRHIYLFDNVNIPAVISYLAANTLVHENDHTHKNYFLYQDTNNTGEWMFVPWDKDLTFGINNGIGGLIADQDWPDDPDRSPSHPFFGSRYHQKIDYQWNRLFDAVYTDSTARQMYLRRLRTLMDTYLQAPGTSASQLWYENRLDEWVDRLYYEMNSTGFTANVNALKNQYLAVRRQHLYVNHLHGSTWPDDCAQIPDAQPAQFTLQIGAVDYCPASWNQDEEYIEVINPNTFAADISGWTVEGAVEHTFPGGTVIPAEGALYLTPNALAFRSRAVSPTGGQHLFVQGNYKGHLSSWGETITIYDRSRNVAATKTYTGNPSDVQRYLRITEIMYHPLDAADPAYTDEDYEYLELTNIGTTPLLLDGVKFTEGIAYQFPAGVQLNAGEFLLLVKNAAAFTSRYAVPQGVQILSGYVNNLSNGGEILKLEDQTNSSVLDFSYNDKWYAVTDGQGFSLVFAAELTAAPEIWDQKLSWRASVYSGGSPGAAEQGLAANSIVFNELLAHSHDTAPDWIELHNKTGQDINIGGWFLTDDNTDLTTIQKYQIPDNTILPQNGYLLFYENTSFGSLSQPLEKRFGLSEGGETVYLYSGQNGQVTGYYQSQQKFDASETNVTFGRYEKAELSGGYDFTRMAVSTPGDDNSGPLIPNIVITEIHYNPPAGTDYEYVELLNRSGSAVTLMTEVSTETSPGVFITEQIPWRLEGTGFEFPSGITINAGQKILVAKNPAMYPSASCTVYGPYDGKLDNAGEEIEIRIPGDLEYGKSRAWIPIEKVDYKDVAPWPTSPDGNGQSLKRKNTAAYGNDYSNWEAADPTPGY